VESARDQPVSASASSLTENVRQMRTTSWTEHVACECRLNTAHAVFIIRKTLEKLKSTRRRSVQPFLHSSRLDTSNCCVADLLGRYTSIIHRPLYRAFLAEYLSNRPSYRRGRRQYVFRLFVRLCVRQCIAACGRKRSPTGFLVLKLLGYK